MVTPFRVVITLLIYIYNLLTKCPGSLSRPCSGWARQCAEREAKRMPGSRKRMEAMQGPEWLERVLGFRV